MKKFLGKLFTLALYAFVIGAIGKAGYDIYNSKAEADRTMELAARFENYVPEEVAPYVENPDYVQYYYKSIGGDFYSEQSWEMEGIPSYVTMTGGGFEEQDVTEYFFYDETVHTFIISEELLSTLEKEYYHFQVYYDEETFEEFGFHVEEELVNNVPAERAYRPDSKNGRIYIKLSDGQDVSLYYSNIGDNRIVDVLKYNEGSSLGLLDPDNYIVAPSGNKVTLKKEYLQSLKPNTKMEYGVRLADGTIVYEPWTNFWTIEDEWAGLVVENVTDYSLSEGGDYVINIKRNDTQKILEFSIATYPNGEFTRHLFIDCPDWFGHEYMEKWGNTITIPEEVMKTLPVGEELMLHFYYYFDYDRNVYSIDDFSFKVIP